MPHPEIEPLLADAKAAGCMYPYAYAAGALAVKLDAQKKHARHLAGFLTRLQPSITDAGIKLGVQIALDHPPI